QVTEDSEAAEPRLHRQLYDLLRDQSRNRVEAQLARSAQLLRRGFIDPVREPQRSVADSVEQLRQGVERAAGSVLGDETTELRFAQRELDELARDIQREAERRSGVLEAGSSGQRDESGASSAGTGEPEDAAAPGDRDPLEQLREFAEASGGARGEAEGAGPLTGSG